MNRDLQCACRLLVIASVAAFGGVADGCARQSAAPMASPEAPTDPRVARFVEAMAEEEAKARLAEAWRQQDWPTHHARWEGRVLRFGERLGEPWRLDFREIAFIRVRPAFERLDREYELLIRGRVTPEHNDPPTLMLRTDRWAEARDLAAAAHRLSGVDVTSEFDRTDAPPINP